jgi:ABC-type polar amino acid transport system ATPase subunit
MRGKYERIKIHSGGNRAIVAVARTPLLRMRRMLYDKQAYVLDLAA